MNKEPRTMQVADAVTASRAPENTPEMVKKISKTTYKVHAVSYTHLDVYKRQATIQPESCLNMLHVMYLWIPMVLSLIITFIMSRMNVEDANKKLRKQLEEC